MYIDLVKAISSLNTMCFNALSYRKFNITYLFVADLNKYKQFMHTKKV